MELKDLTEGEHLIRPVDPICVTVNADGQITKMDWTSNEITVEPPA